MNSIDVLAAFFGWCTLINLGIYLFTVAVLAGFRGRVYRINAKIFAISEDEVARASFQYVGNYKLAITMLFFVPYVALKAMS